MEEKISTGQTYEEKLKRLEKVVEELQKEQADLQTTVNLYEEGVLLYKECKRELDDMDMKVKIILGEQEEDFLEEERNE